MVVRPDAVGIDPYDRLIEPLRDILPSAASNLLGVLRPLGTGAIELWAHEERIGPIAVVFDEEDQKKTLLVTLPGGTASAAAAAGRRVAGLPFAPGELMGAPTLGRLVLDEQWLALVAENHLDAWAQAVTTEETGRPRAVPGPIEPMGADVIAQVWGVGPFEAYGTADLPFADRIELVLRRVAPPGTSRADGLALRHCLTPRAGALVEATEQVRATLAAAEGPEGVPYRRAAVAEDGGRVCVAVGLTGQELSQLLLQP